MRLSNYIIQHWWGKISLTRAFWVNLVLVFIVLQIAQQFLFPPFIENEVAVTSVVIIYLIVVKLIIYPWQLVGVLRVCNHCIRTDSGRAWANVAQIALVASLAATLVTALDTYQSLQIFKQDLIHSGIPREEPLYSLDLIEGGSLIHLRGPFEIGITNKVEELIGRNSGISGIILDSEGGQIYEGRGLARVIREHGLRTFSLDHCLSSCTTAFIAGTERTLGTNARLGFHQYKTYSIIPSVDVDNEQAKDVAIFVKQGVSPQFLEKMFNQPPQGMWWPEIDELLDAGVVQHISDNFGDNNPGASEE
jgi:hypothetical protein